MVKVDQRKYKCKYCSYKGFKPMLRLHMYMEHKEDINTGEALQID